MFIGFSIKDFVSQYVTGREDSLFLTDKTRYAETLTERIKGKSVLVIGGAGTIGSAFIKSLLPYQPSQLVIVDISENGLTELVRDIRSTYNLFIPDVFVTYPMDFGGAVFAKWLSQSPAFDIVANFAAHKHVRSEKDRFAVEAMIQNNVFNNQQLLEILRQKPPLHFFCVSTDKAANPVSVMGASKSLMERMLMTYQDDFPISTARFANVAFSNGSLLAGFMDRVRKRQPLAAPHDVLRYFVSSEEAGDLCLMACILGQSGDIFFPKLPFESQKKFSDIALAYLNALDFTPAICSTEAEAKEFIHHYPSTIPHYPIYLFETDTSGEKGFEEFYTPGEKVDLETYEGMGVVKSFQPFPEEEMAQMLKELRTLFEQKNLSKAEIVHVLQKLVPDFQHIETGKGLDTKM